MQEKKLWREKEMLSLLGENTAGGVTAEARDGSYTE